MIRPCFILCVCSINFVEYNFYLPKDLTIKCSWPFNSIDSDVGSVALLASITDWLKNTNLQFIDGPVGLILSSYNSRADLNKENGLFLIRSNGCVF